MKNLLSKGNLIALLFILILLTGCTSDKDFSNGKRQLENMGYTEVVNTGYNSFCCSDKETYSTGFSAKDKKGEVVKGCFCSANLKGVTIRFE